MTGRNRKANYFVISGTVTAAAAKEDSATSHLANTECAKLKAIPF
jgi:hypothetical protein